jgi:hypothetical protein
LPTNRHSDAARATRARVLACFFLAGSGLGFLLLAFFPLASGTNRVGEAAALAVGSVVGIVLLAAAQRVPDWAIDVALAVGTLVISAGVAFGNGASSHGTQIFYLWSAFYAFYFLERREAVGQLAFVGVAYGAALGAAVELGTAVTQWTITMGTLSVVGAMIASLVRRLSLREAESSQRMDALQEAEEHFRRAFDDAAIGMASCLARRALPSRQSRARRPDRLRAPSARGNGLPGHHASGRPRVRPRRDG